MSRGARWFWLILLYTALAAMAVHWKGIKAPEVGWSPPTVDSELRRVSRWLESHPDDVGALLQRGNLWLELEAYRAAELDFKRVVALDYNAPPVLNNLAWSLANQGRYLEALPFAEAGVQGQREAYSLDTLAFVCAGLGEKERAHQLYREALALDPGNEEIEGHLRALR